MATATKSGCGRATCGGRTAERPGTVRTFLPDNLDLGRLGVRPEWREYAAFVVGGLYLRRHMNRQGRADDYFPLSSKVLTEVLPRRDYRRILDELIGAGVVECRLNAGGREGYAPGVRSKCFRLAASHRDARFREVALGHAELVPKVLAQRRREAARRDGVHRHLFDMLDGLEVDARSPADSLPLALIDGKQPHFTICSQGRVHSPLTNMRKIERGFLSFGGEPLWQVDIKNSQPLLLGLSLKDEKLQRVPEFIEYQRRLKGCSASGEARDVSSILENSHAVPDLPARCNPVPYVPTNARACQNDFDRYLAICLEGQLYEHLVSRHAEYRCEPVYDAAAARSACKAALYPVVYGDPRYSATTPMGETLSREFPSLWGKIRASYYALGHGGLPRQMQTVESYLVIWKACSAIARRFPHAPLFTVHDSLVTTEEFLEPFSEALRGEYRAAFGVEPKLETSPFGDPARDPLPRAGAG